jgi:predicted ferric reductase
MTYYVPRGLLWLSAYAALALLPLLVARAGRVPDSRGFLVEFGVALGFVGLALIALQFIFSGRLRRVVPSFGTDNMLHFHRRAGIFGLLFVLVHPVVLLTADSAFLSFFDPRLNLPRALALVLVVAALIGIGVTSLWRDVVGLSYEWWRLLHGVLALSILGIGLAHVLQVGHYINTVWKQGVLVLFIAAMGYPLVHTQLVRPWRSRGRPYRITRVQPERDACWSITIEPDGHDGMRFRPGQFAWMTVGDTPFSLQQHPFSFASSARRREITFTAKEVGDFTSTWKDLTPGTRLFLEGPFGAFVPDPAHSTNLFLVMGGIGVTPGMCMLRTMRDDDDRRHVVLIYGSRDWDTATFREELEELEQVLDLKVVHVLEHPPAGWNGERGLVTSELLRRYVPETGTEWQYFICGPPPLMNLAEVTLREAGVPWRCVYTERFTIV